jgi:hypothetical protein
MANRPSLGREREFTDDAGGYPRSREVDMVARLALVAVMTVCACATGCTEDRTEAEVDWSLSSPPVGREVNVRAEFGGSSCSEFKDWDVAETSTSVTIRATAEFFGNECTADLVVEPMSIVLDEPLGDRRLLGCRPESVVTAGSNRPTVDDCRETAS